MQQKLKGELDQLVETKEAEISEMVKVLDGLKGEIGMSEIQTESL